MTKPFEDSEKRYMLAEMIKASQIDPAAVVEFIKSYTIQPNWMDMRYPHGRTPNECKQVAEGMGIAAPPSQFQPQYTQPLQHVPSETLQNVFQPTRPLAPFPPIKRKPSFESAEPLPKRLAVAVADTQIQRPRAVNIQPRPSSNGPPSVPIPTLDTATPSSLAPALPTARKRGRPSKADRQVKTRGLLPGVPPPLAPAPKHDRMPSTSTPPLAEYSPQLSSSRASSEPKAVLRTRPATPQLQIEVGQKPENEHYDGSDLRQDTGYWKGNSAPLRLEQPHLVLEEPRSSSAVPELVVPQIFESTGGQSPAPRVAVSSLLKTGIQAT